MSSGRRQRSFSMSSFEINNGEHDNSQGVSVGDDSGHSNRSPSIPSLQTALFDAARIRSSGSATAAAASSSSDSGYASASASATSNTENGTAAVAPMSNDHERQLLLLLLLAQVCSLHDSTPRTYTVHVLQLFERGILDRESIQFLFELGLVPAIDTSGMLTQGPTSVPTTTSVEEEVDMEACTTPRVDTMSVETTAATITVSSELAITTNNNSTLARAQQTNSTHQNTETLRSMEAKAIRRQLSQHDIAQQKKRSGMSSCDNQGNTRIPQGDDIAVKSWEVEHFPLSLSRYQREFRQIALLNTGGFGSVYHVVRKMDSCDYAMKLITFDSVGYSNENIQNVIREVQCLAKVSEHPNIVRYYTSWLEPSWMTGGAAGPKSGRQHKHFQQLQYDAMNRASPQKLLQDIENLLDASYDIDQVDENEDKYGLSTSSDSSCFSDSDDDSMTFNKDNRHRRYSWDSSLRSTNESSWKNDTRNNFAPWADPFDISGKSSTIGAARQRTNQTSPRLRQYKYQVTLYIQMQLCHPATLEDWIRERNRRIPESDHASRIGPALDVFRQLCSGLAHIHDKNIVHRDLKPANAFVSKDGRIVKIGDFGLSKEIHGIAERDSKPTSAESPQNINTARSFQKEDFSLKPPSNKNDTEDERQIIPRAADSRTTAIVKATSRRKVDPMTVGIGTASYAAPEQIRSKYYGTPADIFSLGLILLELCCNFETQHEKLHIFQQCRNQTVPSWIKNHYPDVASTILACTCPNPDERPTAKELFTLSEISSPRSNVEVQILKGQLVEKDKLLAEKDEMIEKLKSEMERMRATLYLTNGEENND